MNNCEHRGCGSKNSACSYFISVPGGDSLFCKPYKREQFYQTGYSSSSSSSLCAIYTKTIKKLSTAHEEPCTCRTPVCVVCPKTLNNNLLKQIHSSNSFEECCSCVCHHPRYSKFCPEICRLTEMVDVASSVSDLLKDIRESRAQTEQIQTKSRKEQTKKDKTENDALDTKKKSKAEKKKEKKKYQCECLPVESVYLKTVVSRGPHEESSTLEMKSSLTSVTTWVSEDVVVCEPCKLKHQSHHSCNCKKDKTSKKDLDEDININLEVDVKKNKSLPVHKCTTCKCKHKNGKKESEKKLCKCNISPPIVICDKQPEKNKSLLQTIRTMIANSSRTDGQIKAKQEEPVKDKIKCACKRKPEQSQDDSISVCLNTKGKRKCEYYKKLSDIEEQCSSPSKTDKEQTKCACGKKHIHNFAFSTVNTKYCRRYRKPSTICSIEKQPSKHRSMISNPSRTDEERTKCCLCKKKIEQAQNRTYTVIKHKLPNAEKPKIKCACKVKPERTQEEICSVTFSTGGTRHCKRRQHKHIEQPTTTPSKSDEEPVKTKPTAEEIKNKVATVAAATEKRGSKSDRKHYNAEEQQMKSQTRKSGDRKRRSSKREENSIALVKPDRGSKSSHRSSRRSKQSELNTIFLNQSEASTDRSVFINANEKTVQYLFLETFERFPLCLVDYRFQDVTCNFEVNYKSILWLSSGEFNDMLKLNKPSNQSIQTDWKPLQTSSSFTKMKRFDKISRVDGMVEQCENNDKNFLSIVKKFERYKNQQQTLENFRRKIGNSYHKKQGGNIFMKLRERRKVYFKVRSDYCCRIFCNFIGPVIYFIYLVIFLWITF